jgi:TatD DNase family protein
MKLNVERGSAERGLLDTHCHLDRYPDALAAAREAERERVTTIGVTNLPSHFEAGLPHVRSFQYIRLAVGLHPLAANAHAAELPAFRHLLDKTSYVGEVGLDFSKEGLPTRAEQEASFREVLAALAGRPKFVTLHSRRAEGLVLDLLREFRVRPVVFHWYSGSLSVLDEAAKCGHFFSVNPAMVKSASGQKVVARIPRDRVLTETDGPHVRVGNRPARPADVRHVVEYLSERWGMSVPEVVAAIWANFRAAIAHLK